MKKKRKAVMDQPDSMRGEIDLNKAHRRFRLDERADIRAQVGASLQERQSDKLIDELGEWIERYFRSFERQKPPSFAVQKKSRKLLHCPTARLVDAMKSADNETRKRIFHFLSDYPPEPVLPREELEEDFDYGYRIFRRLRKDLKLLDRAIIASKRSDDVRGQARPATYLFYRVTRIWIGLTGSTFTMSFGTHKKEQLTAIGFYQLALGSTRVASKEERNELKALMERSNDEAFHATLVAVHTKLYGGVPERDNRSEKKQSRSDNDQGRKPKGESDT